MSFEERNTVIYLVVSLLVAALFGSRIWQGSLDGSFAGPEGLRTWARTILWMIPLAIGLTIAFVIGGQILYGIVTGDGEIDTRSDERDNLVSMRAMRVTGGVFSTGWIGAIVLIALEHEVLAAFNLMLFAGWFSDVAGNLAKLWLYRRGGWI